MNKPVSGFLVFIAMALSIGLIGLGMAGVDIAKLARVAFGFVIIGLAASAVLGFIASLLRP